MFHSLHSLAWPVRGIALATMLAGLCAPALAETGLRITPRSNEVTVSGDTPASLRFSLSRYDSNFLDAAPPATPLLLNLPQNASNTRNSALWADWYPFNSGLRTSAGLVWGDNRRNGNVFDTTDSSQRSRAFLGLGWTSMASSSSAGSGWRLDADVGASLSSVRDCANLGGQCIAPGSPGLKPNSSGDGIRWNPFISIGASFQY